MRDLTLDDLADEVREVLMEDGISVPASTIRAITKQFIKQVETRVAAGDSRLRFGKSISAIYQIPDTKSLCDEFAAGENPRMLNYIDMLKRGTLNVPAQSFVKRRMGTTSDEHGKYPPKKKESNS
jgi:hypothetical protein